MVALIPAQSNGLIAFQDGAPVGAARYVREDSQTAELAISVIDAVQGQGVGSRLLPLLTELACEDGITTLTGTVSNNNEAMWHLLNKLPYKLTRFSEGQDSTFTLDLIGGL
jgi:acetyltransferase